MITLSKSTRTAASRDTLILLDSHSKLRNLDLERNDRQYLTEQLQADPQLAVCDVSGRLVMVHMISKAEPSVQMEKARRAGDAMAARLNTARRTEAQLISLQDSSAHTLALAEGVPPWAAMRSGSTRAMRKVHPPWNKLKHHREGSLGHGGGGRNLATSARPPGPLATW
jgi:hypothetical protein